MLINLLPRVRRCILAAALVVGWPFAGHAQGGCPDSSGAILARGWEAYRADSVAAAGRLFAPVAACGVPGGLIGLGFVALRQARLSTADSLFGAALARDSSLVDAWEGLARTAWRRGDPAGAARAAGRALALAPEREDLRALRRMADPDWDRPPLAPRARPDTLQLYSRVAGEGFEVRGPDGRWTPFYVQGVNLGVALPGKFPSEFPADSGLYAGWFDTLSAMHANTLRVYTILPPTFYRALRGWNLRHPDRPLWLVHGVWTELPPVDDFDAPEWKAEFRAEMRRVVDLVHGALELPSRPGHAAGRYDADVSRWTFGYIIGREWEPFAVKAYDSTHPGDHAFLGTYLAAARAPAMDAWLAEQCDYLLTHEAARWNVLRPIAYTNWPTLDPIPHPTESGTEEERAWRRRAGRPVTSTRREYENDAIGLDANLVRPTAANPAGWFASYHAYPYYPDFMLYDPGYSAARSSEGPSNYFGYLQDLRRHHEGIPFVISEYGVPSSRGNAHWQPQGWSHGGHDEAQMAAIDARLTREIRESGAAGAILFAWTDEWFKRNWVVTDLELPEERNRLWLNVMDAEQQYGILGQYAGDAGASPVLGGDPSRWRALEALSTGSGLLRSLNVGADEAFLYLAIAVAPNLRWWDSLDVAVAFDTYLPQRGQTALHGGQVRSDVGFEFLLELDSPDSAQLRVLPSYNPYAGKEWIISGDEAGQFYRRPVTIANADDGRFDELFVITNRARYGRAGEFWPARGLDRGEMRYGTEAGGTAADWYVDLPTGLIEVRIPWALLNVTDPSSRSVLYDPPDRMEGEFGTAVTPGFRLGAVAFRKRGGVAGAIPALRDGRWRATDFREWSWRTWEVPSSHSRLKPVYDSLRTTWAPR